MQPWTTDAHSVSLVAIPPALLHALAAGSAGDEVTEYLRSDVCRGLWKYRSAQIQAAPGDAEWITRLVMTDGNAVGVAGFHGPPDDRGMVEVGYRIDPEYRRRGYARAALEILLTIAAGDQRVRVVRACIRPDNIPSRMLVDQYGFTVTGEQWDEEDGLEIILEVATNKEI